MAAEMTIEKALEIVREFNLDAEEIKKLGGLKFNDIMAKAAQAKVVVEGMLNTSITGTSRHARRRFRCDMDSQTSHQ